MRIVNSDFLVIGEDASPATRVAGRPVRASFMQPAAVTSSELGVVPGRNNRKFDRGRHFDAQFNFAVLAGLRRATLGRFLTSFDLCDRFSFV